MQTSTGNLSGALDVACGTNHTAVLMGNGTVWTVGLNTSGELGNGNTTRQLKAVQVLTATGPLTGVTALAAGASHTLALGTSGEVWAWGSNAVGQLGNNSTVNSTRAAKVPSLTGIVAIAGGERFSYAIKNDGTAWAFGDNAYGQLGNNSTTASRIPVQVRTSAGNLSGVKAAAAGMGHGVFLTSTGGVLSVGLNSSGQLGNNSTTNGLLAVPSRGLSGNLSGIAEVACGDAFTLFLSTNGTISAVGSNTNGQLGDGTRISRLTAVPVAGLTSVSFVCAGADRSFAVKSDGGVFAWGGDLYGAQGQGARGFEWSWTPLPQWSAFLRAAAGSSHTLWLKADGSVWAAGRNLYGQLGNGLTSDSLVPVRTQSATGNLTAIQDVAAGSAHSLALAQNGAVWAWGLNSSGRLGDGTGTSRTKAVLALDAVGPISGTSAVAVGDAFSLALRQGSVWAWGLNSYSQLGDGTITSRSKAVPVLTTSGSLAGITALAAGANHGVALKGDGTVWVWGYNNQGQLGLGNTLTQNRAVSIPGVNDALAIAAGSAQTYILRSIGGGTAWGAGQNNVGQLADGTTTARSSLVQVQSTTGALTGLAWVRSGALAHHAAAGRMDGTSWIWGQNDAGQLATGNFTSALKALALPPGIRPQTIGARFTLARRAGYEWVASGSFFDGQWGDGRKAYYPTPTLVRGMTFAQTPPDTDGDGVPDWQEIARGSSVSIADTDGDGLSDASDTMLSCTLYTQVHAETMADYLTRYNLYARNCQISLRSSNWEYADAHQLSQITDNASLYNAWGIQGGVTYGYISIDSSFDGRAIETITWHCNVTKGNPWGFQDPNYIQTVGVSYYVEEAMSPGGPTGGRIYYQKYFDSIALLASKIRTLADLTRNAAGGYFNLMATLPRPWPTQADLASDQNAFNSLKSAHLSATEIHSLTLTEPTRYFHGKTYTPNLVGVPTFGPNQILSPKQAVTATFEFKPTWALKDIKDIPLAYGAKAHVGIGQVKFTAALSGTRHNGSSTTLVYIQGRGTAGVEVQLDVTWGLYSIYRPRVSFPCTLDNVFRWGQERFAVEIQAGPYVELKGNFTGLASGVHSFQQTPDGTRTTNSVSVGGSLGITGKVGAKANVDILRIRYQRNLDTGNLDIYDRVKVAKFGIGIYGEVGAAATGVYRWGQYTVTGNGMSDTLGSQGGQIGQVNLNAGGRIEADWGPYKVIMQWTRLWKFNSIYSTSGFSPQVNPTLTAFSN